jgi:hypothetical protein
VSDYSIVSTDEVEDAEEQAVELWAVSRKIEDSDSTKVDDFWEASPEARQ